MESGIIRRRGKQDRYTFKKSGSFGIFSTDNSIPIEFILATFRHDQLEYLTLARDVQTELNFEMMVQRDIDEKRASKEIANYLNPKIDGGQNIAFLPPLIAAVVGVDDSLTIEEFYPEYSGKVDKDDMGEIYIREWEGIFKVTHYPDSDGYKIRLNSEQDVSIDTSQAEIEISHSKESKGARLVVIDGQHRLYALNQLKTNHPDAVKNIVLPVCIVYAPKSNISEATSSTPKVYEILRHLFVDVNETVVRVSGHFHILLSDNTLGGLTCRAFCASVLEDYGEEGLALIEWNTKSDKESKTISKHFTITSIGVLNEALEDYFKLKKWREALYYLLGMSEHDAKELFEPTEEDDAVKIPEGFPWSGFGYAQKPFLDKMVKSTLSPVLIKLFLGSSEFKKIVSIFESCLEKEIRSKMTEGNPDLTHLRLVEKHLLDGTSIQGLLKSEAYLGDFVKAIKQQISEQIRSICRTKVFQKALIGGVIEFADKVRYANIRVEHVTEAYSKLLDDAFSNRVDLFRNDDTRTYLQTTIYSGVKIKPVSHTVDQIKRLILAQLGKRKLVKGVVAKLKEHDDSIDEESLISALQELGVSKAGEYNNVRFDIVQKAFMKDYPVNYQLTPDVRKELEEAERAFKEAAGKGDDSDAFADNFQGLIRKHIKDEIMIAKNQLDEVLGFKTSSQSLEEAFEDTEI